MQSDDLPLILEGVSKEYRIYPSPRARLKSIITGRSFYKSHWALKDVSFSLSRGQCLGLIGHNGAGKSTLLKLITGTIAPSSGIIRKKGLVTAILELGAGFHPDFTGRQNLYFGASLIGISQEQMKELEASILEFAAIGEAIDRPVKTYSSGMTVRLAFALVTALVPDILIIDEALAVGDQNFQKKCIARIQEFKNAGCTILFCSHSPYHVRVLCDTAIWMDAGKMRAIGNTEEVLGAYEMDLRLKNDAQNSESESNTPQESSQALPQAKEQEPENPTPPAPISSSARLISVEIENLEKDNSDKTTGKLGQSIDNPAILKSNDLIVHIKAHGHENECPNMGFMIEQSRGVGITSLASHEENFKPRDLGNGIWQATLSFKNLPLHSGQYVVSAFLFDSTGLIVYETWFQFLHFNFVSPTLMPGLVRLPHEWS